MRRGRRPRRRRGRWVRCCCALSVFWVCQSVCVCLCMVRWERCFFLHCWSSFSCLGHFAVGQVDTLGRCIGTFLFFPPSSYLQPLPPLYPLLRQRTYVALRPSALNRRFLLVFYIPCLIFFFSFSLDACLVAPLDCCCSRLDTSPISSWLSTLMGLFCSVLFVKLGVGGGR